MYESGCFDYVPPDGNCAVWAAMQACNGASMNLDNKEEYNKKYPEMLELRQKVADRYFKPGSEIYKKHATDKCWVFPDYFLDYLCDANKSCYTFDLDKLYKDTPITRFYGFENLLNGCPFTYIVNKNHFVNLSSDPETRKKFVPFLYDFWCCDCIYRPFIYKDKGISAFLKNNAIFFVLGRLFLDKDVKDVKRDEINRIMDDFLKDVPNKYKPVLTFKLILFIFEKYKNKVLDTLNFKITANEFLSDVLVDLKKEVVDKNPKFNKKQEDKKNMQVDVDEIFKKFDIEIGNNISFKDENFGYLKTISYDLYNNYADDVPKDDNCVFWLAMQAFEKRIIDKKADYQEMLGLRKNVADFWKNKLGLSEQDEIYKELITPGTRVAPDLVYYYLCEANGVKNSFQIFPGIAYFVGRYSGRNPENPGQASIKFDNLKNSFFEIINGAPCCVLNDIHSKTLKDNHDLRKEMFIKLLDLDLALFFKGCVCNNSFNKNVFKRKLKFLFYFKDDKAQNFNDNFDSIINSVPDEFKTRKLCELSVFMYKKFKAEVLEKENKDITADEFYSSTFKEFKEKYIDNDPDLKQNKKTEENKEEPSKDSKSEPKINPDPNHKSQETTEPQIEPGPENIPKDPDLNPTPTVDQTTPKSEISEQKNDQQTNKNKEKDDNKKDENHDKQKSESKKKIFSGPKWLYIFLCIITLSIFYFFRSSPEKKENKLPSEKNKKSNVDKNDKSQIDDEKDKMVGNKEESDKNLKTKKPLSGLANNNSQTKKDNKDLSDRGSL